MTYLSTGIQPRLENAFKDHALAVTVREGSIIVENSKDQTEEKIRSIVDKAGFCPIFSTKKSEGNFVFTVTPYALPPQLVDPYCTKEELSSLLHSHVFVTPEKTPLPKDIHEGVNNFRSIVSSALKEALSELILLRRKQDFPIVELGSRIGYSFSEEVLSQLIRIQSDPAECHLLQDSTSQPIYQMDVEKLHATLLKHQKKVPLFFALHLFDRMTPFKRLTTLMSLSELQQQGDRILICLDTNPHLDSIVTELENAYPGHTPYPFYPLDNSCAMLSCVMVPTNLYPKLEHLDEAYQEEAKVKIDGSVSKLHWELFRLQHTLNLPVIPLEMFFARSMEKTLDCIGYKTDVYYCNAFALDEIKSAFSVKENLAYKAVTDTWTMRQWSIGDPKFIASLKTKGLTVSPRLGDLESQIQETHQKIQGAELLVIEATKL